MKIYPSICVLIRILLLRIFATQQLNLVLTHKVYLLVLREYVQKRSIAYSLQFEQASCKSESVIEKIKIKSDYFARISVWMQF